MTHKLFCTTLAWLCLLAPVAHAEPVLCAAGGRVTDDQADLTLDGRPGVWLELSLAREVLSAFREDGGYVERLALATRRLELRTTEANELRWALAAATQARDELRGIVRSAEARRIAAERVRDAWYRAPSLLLGAGAVLGAGLAVLLAFAIGGAS